MEDYGRDLGFFDNLFVPKEEPSVLGAGCGHTPWPTKAETERAQISPLNKPFDGSIAPPRGTVPAISKLRADLMAKIDALYAERKSAEWVLGDIDHRIERLQRLTDDLR